MAVPPYRYFVFLALLGAMFSGASGQQASGRFARQALEREDQCKAHYDNYTNSEIFDNWLEGHVHASNLASCIFDQLPEWAKSEFTTVSITLGLIPPALLVLGPDMTGIALLSMRRPLLASLLAFGSPALRAGPDPVEFLKLTPKRRWIMVVVISVLEYAIAGAPGGLPSVVPHVPSRVLGRDPAFPGHIIARDRSTAPLGSLGVPVKLMCDYAIQWRIKKVEDEVRLSGARNQPLYFRAVEEGPVWLFFTQFVNLASLANLLMGGIILSIIFFVLFRKAVITVAMFLAAAVACEFVLSFEPYWMRFNAFEAKPR
ncbi:hypothetical protein F5X97DRAFT_328972 [Nemania serpens]|nr:hypothetical protein F5X97DRAFT_328972 [Nemania serpens]